VSEDTNPEPVELTRQAVSAWSRHDLAAVMGFFAPDGVFDLSDAGFGTFEGAAAATGFLEDWWRTWGDHLVEVEELVDFGSGTVFVAVREDGRLVGSDGHIEQRRGWAFLWVDGKIARLTAYLDLEEARAAAERLAEERG
jgi:ketosteroid isomerase-like protein